MAAALRSVRRAQQVLLLPRISVTSVRAESGGKSSPDTEISKTLVSFPVKVSHFQQPATGENRCEPLKPEKAALLDVGKLGGQSERELQVGQEVSHDNAQHSSVTSHKDDDSSSSSSSSSSDSSSDSESEGEDKEPVTELQANKGESDGGRKGLPSGAQKASSNPGLVSLEKDHPIAEEQKNGIGTRGVNAEDLQDIAPVVSTEEQSLHTAILPTKMTPPRADKMETLDGTVPIEGAYSTAVADSEEIKILSTSEELLTGGVVTLAPESGETQLPSTTTSEEFPVESLKMLAPKSRETLIQLSSIAEALPAGGIEMTSLESIETQILSTIRSEELSAGVVETLAPESVDSQILSTATSEELSAGETLAPESVDSQILSTTSEELPAGETLAPESVDSQILSTTSEELPAGGVEMLAPESVDSQILLTTSEELPTGGVEILSTTTSEELPAEEGAAELQETSSPQEPCAAPPEPFDNTRYQNLQHFNYTPFTFVDVDVELAKYRLPQPSSGRPSPRH